MSTLFEALDNSMRVTSGSEIGIRVLVSPEPFVLNRAEGMRATARRGALRDYQRTLVELWKRNELPEFIDSIPTWSAPLPDGAWRELDTDLLIPMFIRTDESLEGKVFEIQCPGSWWGTLQVMQEHIEGSGPRLADGFIGELDEVFPGGADILHLFESSTSPHENRTFADRIRRSGNRFRYWSLDPEALTDDCNWIRAHSFSGLVSEDLFRVRLERFAEGELRFDLPPIPLFDQKAPMALPFDRETASNFTDAHRSLFPYTAIVRQDGFVLETGELVGIQDIPQRAECGLDYFAKYAGMDTTRNFGARGVFQLSECTGAGLQVLADQISVDVARNEPWIMQRAETSTGELRYIAADGSAREGRMNLKVSEFFGPRTHLGSLVQGSVGSSVRWTPDTVLSLVKHDPK